MREIKFRAWDEGNKVMHHNFQFLSSGYEGHDWIIFTSDEAPHEKNRKEGIVLNNPYFRQQLKVMQYTGLKDKNGREIYEGDILTTSNDNPEHDLWNQGDYGCSAVYWDEEFLQWLGTKWTWDNLGEESVYSMQFVEVIGNIYENPELLEDHP